MRTKLIQLRILRGTRGRVLEVHLRGFERKTHRPETSPRAFATFNPLGIILAIMPWAFPFWQVMRFAASHFMADMAAF